MNNREIGDYGERLAENYLQKKGYTIVEKNFWCRYGEIDLIARIKDYLAFIEVKLSSQEDFIAPCYKIHKDKQEKIKRAAQYYLNFRNLNFDLRFDVVLINDQEAKPEINLIKDAFWIKERI